MDGVAIEEPAAFHPPSSERPRTMVSTAADITQQEQLLCRRDGLVASLIFRVWTKLST